MPIGAVVEIMVTITNVIRKSEFGSKIFMGSDEAESRFDEWQNKVIDQAEKLYAHWDDTMISMHLEEMLEQSFKEIFPQIKEIA